MIDLQRIEELSLNSSAPPAQLIYDGWLLRLSPGKAKRARSVNAVYPSTLLLDRKIAHCERLYEDADLPMLFRITPFSQPASLEAELERRGYTKLEETSVQCAPLEKAPPAGGARQMPLAPWIDAVAALRGSPSQHREAHLARLERMPLAKRAVALEEGGRVVATGLTVVDAAATVVAPASAGTVRYDWQAGDTAVPGRYQARFRADFGGGQVQSFPNAEDFIDVLIAEQVA